MPDVETVPSPVTLRRHKAAAIEAVKWNATEDRLLTPAEVAAMFRVSPKTVTRWAKTGRLTSVRTPGNHRRFFESEVRDLLGGDPS